MDILLYASFAVEVGCFLLVFPFVVKFIRAFKRLEWAMRKLRTNFQALSLLSHALYLTTISIGTLVGLLLSWPDAVDFQQALQEKPIDATTAGGVAYHVLATNLDLASIAIFTLFCVKELYVQKHGNRRWSFWARRVFLPFWLLFVALYDVITIVLWVFLPLQSSESQDPALYELSTAANAGSSLLLLGTAFVLWRTVNYTQRHMPFQSTRKIFFAYAANAILLLSSTALTLTPYREIGMLLFPFYTCSQRLVFLWLFGSARPLPQPIVFGREHLALSLGPQHLKYTPI